MGCEYSIAIDVCAEAMVVGEVLESGQDERRVSFIKGVGRVVAREAPVGVCATRRARAGRCAQVRVGVTGWGLRCGWWGGVNQCCLHASACVAGIVGRRLFLRYACIAVCLVQENAGCAVIAQCAALKQLLDVARCVAGRE